MDGNGILIVDDNPQNLKLIRVLLRDKGYDVRVVSDAEEALQILQGFTPRLILMDLQLPGMDGLELTRRLKSDPTTGHVRIVALTAYAMKGDDRRAFDAGCDDYVTKPIDIEALTALIASHMNPR